MSEIKAHFKLKDSESKEPTLILLKSYFNNQRFVYSTKERVLPQLWDTSTERPITDKEIIKQVLKQNPYLNNDLNKINTQLNRYEDELAQAYATLELLKIVITPKEIKKLLDKELRKKPESDTKLLEFFQVFDVFLASYKDKYSEPTLKSYRTLLKNLKEFEINKKYPIKFDSIDLNFHDQFKDYLLKHKKQGDKVGLLNNSIGKYFALIKSFMNWSFDRKYHSNLQYKHGDFKVSHASKNEIVTLTEDEFNKLNSCDLTNNKRLEKVRDLFCFATFTGQRWSDIEKFKKEDLKDGWWIFESVKTKKITKVPLTGWANPALQILERYNFDLPVISQQKFNDYLKEIGKLVEIGSPVKIKRYSGNKLITFSKPKYEFMSSHMARRTCVTILLGKGVPPTTVMKLTGHSDLTTLMKYENTQEDALKNEFQRISQG
jgi:integrase